MKHVLLSVALLFAFVAMSLPCSAFAGNPHSAMHCPMHRHGKAACCKAAPDQAADSTAQVQAPEPALLPDMAWISVPPTPAATLGDRGKPEAPASSPPKTTLPLRV